MRYTLLALFLTTTAGASSIVYGPAAPAGYTEQTARTSTYGMPAAPFVVPVLPNVPPTVEEPVVSNINLRAAAPEPEPEPEADPPKRNLNICFDDEVWNGSDSTAISAILDNRELEQAACAQLPLCADVTKAGALGCNSVGISGDCRTGNDKPCKREYINCCKTNSAQTVPAIVTDTELTAFCRCSEANGTNPLWREISPSQAPAGCAALCKESNLAHLAPGVVYQGNKCSVDNGTLEASYNDLRNSSRNRPPDNGRSANTTPPQRSNNGVAR